MSGQAGVAWFWKVELVRGTPGLEGDGFRYIWNLPSGRTTGTRNRIHRC